jgi:hypothetical protein
MLGTPEERCIIIHLYKERVATADQYAPPDGIDASYGNRKVIESLPTGAGGVPDITSAFGDPDILPV